MQDDVTAGAQWLAAQGIADPRRMCIYGASYGGYAALWALVKTPRLFRCGASFAGVSDLGLFLAGDSDRQARNRPPVSVARRSAMRASRQRRLDEVSPLRHAGADRGAGVARPRQPRPARADRPLREDARGAEANGKQVEWLDLRGEQHGIASPENRERFYNALFAFLARNTAAPGPAAGSAADPPQAAASVPE